MNENGIEYPEDAISVPIALTLCVVDFKKLFVKS